MIQAGLHNLYSIAAIIFGFFCFDKIFIPKNNPGRWFILHATANACITIICFQDALKSVLDPVHALDHDSDYTRLPVEAVAALHLYHILMFKCTSEDWFHHIVFVGILCPGAIIVQLGPIQNLVVFFLCGLPGGIDYVMLALVKNKMISKETEKEYNTHINVWIRCPGCVVSGYGIYVAAQYGDIACPPLLAALLAVLTSVNGIYYMQRVVTNFGNMGGRTC